MAPKINSNTYDWELYENGVKLVRDRFPMSRDRIVEFAMGICIIVVLHALFILNNTVQLGKARLTNAFSEKIANEKILLEKLAMEGHWGDSNNGEIVSLVDMKNGKVAGLKFFTSGDSLHIVNWECKQAAVQEIEHALKLLPEESAKKFSALEPVELRAAYRFKVCQKGAASAQ